MCAAVAPLCGPAHLHGRHAARRGEDPGRPSASRSQRPWRTASCSPTTSSSRWSPSAWPSPTPGPAASSSTAVPAPPHQAESVAALLTPGTLDLTVDIEVPTAQALRRLASRRVCTDCGANYSVSSPPKVNWMCDVCGGEVIQRQDDTEDAIRRRLELYERQTAPLIEWYESRGQLAKVSGVRFARRRAAPDHQGRGGTAGPRQEPMRRSTEEIAKMRRAGRVVAEMHEATREAAKAGCDHRRARRRGPRRPRPTRRQVQLPALPGLPGGDLHLAQRHDRPRHPGRLHASRRATSSRSTAAPSSRGTTATPPSPWPSARCRPRRPG